MIDPITLEVVRNELASVAEGRPRSCYIVHNGGPDRGAANIKEKR